jgi:plasmid stability protein
MPKSITIRDVPDETHEELVSRAALSGHSLQEYVRAELIKLADRPDPEVLMTRIRERVRRTGTTLSREQILRYRDMDRE